MQKVFVYGSLLFPELLRALTGKNFESREAILQNYRRSAVLNAGFPAVSSEPGAKVKGRVLLDVDERSLAILKFYEGEEYDCVSEKILVGDDPADALVFVWKAGSEFLNGSWNEKHFEKTWLDDYVRYVAAETLEAFRNSDPE